MNKFEQALVEPVLLSRIRIHLTGLIQGVGFRPHIFKLARARNVQGFVLNTSRGVTIEAEA
ncbi:MAG: acylphosphatase, partial [Verrucomicrobiae bacterium]|nr:acylphosphatase [Verrucomicrobiae bacterium]